MDEHWRAGAPGEPLASATTRIWRIVADVTELEPFSTSSPVDLPVPLTRLLEELRSGSVPDDGSKHYQGPPIGYSWQTVTHEDGKKEEVGNRGGVRGSFGEVTCIRGCDYCYRSRYAAEEDRKKARRALAHLRQLYTQNHPGRARQVTPSIPQRTRPPARTAPPVPHRTQTEAPSPVTTTSPPPTNLSAAAPDFNEKAYWKAREARAKAAINALNIAPSGPGAKPSGSRVSDTGIVFGAKSIDLRPVALRRNDQRNRVRMPPALPTKSSKSPAYTHSPVGLRSPESTSTARSRERRETRGSGDARVALPLPSTRKGQGE